MAEYAQKRLRVSIHFQGEASSVCQCQCYAPNILGEREFYKNTHTLINHSISIFILLFVLWMIYYCRHRSEHYIHYTYSNAFTLLLLQMSLKMYAKHSISIYSVMIWVPLPSSSSSSSSALFLSSSSPFRDMYLCIHFYRYHRHFDLVLKHHIHSFWKLFFIFWWEQVIRIRSSNIKLSSQAYRSFFNDINNKYFSSKTNCTQNSSIVRVCRCQELELDS